MYLNSKCNNYYFIVNFEVLTEVQLKRPSFLDMMLHQLVTGSLDFVPTSQEEGWEIKDLAVLILSFLNLSMQRAVASLHRYTTQVFEVVTVV
jgi:hypothetical protein